MLHVKPRMSLFCPLLAAALVGCQPPAATQPATDSETKVSTASTNAPAAAPATTNASAHGAGGHRFTNRLTDEKSPYLRQHMHNPVDWYPWGEEAFAKARKENKPILLSIGYSTCHWCHVMERESFENEEIAKFLNEHFVSIKVDREERPDVDKIYMTYVQATTGGGGWPLNVFLTPDLKAFFGGTYFPAERKYGRRSFLELLELLASLWADETKRADLLRSAGQQFEQIRNFTSVQPTNKFELSDTMLTNALAKFKSMYEPQHGGFDTQPKFPRPSLPRLLLALSHRSADKEGVNMVLHTCDEMAAGGIYDHIGGGFARYSVDAQWLVPHFEKMLYDNAQLVQLYLDAHLVSGQERHADVVRDVIRYVLRDMTHPDGGFYSAEDADSEGHEGKFYCWTRDQLKELLAADEFKVVERHYGITEEGNFEDHSHPEPLKKLNVLSIVDPKLSKAEEGILQRANAKIFAAREKRVRPGLDDKVLASWNGLMLGAVARAGAVLKEPAYLAAAEKNLAFLKDKLWDAKSGILYHRWRDGERDDVQLLDAYSSLLDGVLHLYEATLKPAHLQFAIDLTRAMTKRFYDPEAGGFYQSDAGSKNLLLRLKEDYDGAEPSGNSVACLALLRLAKITDNQEFHGMAEKTLKLFARNLAEAPHSVPYLAGALDYLLHEPHRVVVVGKADAPETSRLLLAAHGVYQPNKVVLGNTGPVEEFAQKLPAGDSPVVFLCTGTFCHPPTKDPAKVAALLSGEDK